MTMQVDDILKEIEEPVSDLIKRWARDKNADLTDFANTFNAATTATSFDMREKHDNADAIKNCCCYLLYKKFYNQVHKKEKMFKLIEIDTTAPKATKITDYTEDTTKKPKTITKGTVTLPVNTTQSQVIINAEVLKYFASGFFPIGFLSKMFLFVDDKGATYRPSMKGPKYQKVLTFTKAFAKDIDYAKAT